MIRLGGYGRIRGVTCLTEQKGGRRGLEDRKFHPAKHMIKEEKVKISLRIILLAVLAAAILAA